MDDGKRSQLEATAPISQIYTLGIAIHLLDTTLSSWVAA